MRRAERQLDQTLESPTQTSRSQDRNRRRRFWCTRCSGVPGSQRAERPEFEDSHEGRGAGKRGVPTFHCTLPRLAASSTLSLRTDSLLPSVPGTRATGLAAGTPHLPTRNTARERAIERTQDATSTAFPVQHSECHHGARNPVINEGNTPKR